MKVNQTMHIWPRLNPVRLPLVGKCLSMNSATRSLSSSATKTGISSTRSCTAVIFGFIPQAYITSQNHDLIHANVELSGLVIKSYPPPEEKGGLIGALQPICKAIANEIERNGPRSGLISPGPKGFIKGHDAVIEL